MAGFSKQDLQEFEGDESEKQKYKEQADYTSVVGNQFDAPFNNDFKDSLKLYCPAITDTDIRDLWYVRIAVDETELFE